MHPRFTMPAEWCTHRATLMSWPANRALWQDDFASAERAYENLVRAISRFEPVRLIAAPSDHAAVAHRLADAAGQVEVIAQPIDDAWVRDNGPIYVRRADGTPAVVKWQFNGWGNKYPHGNDARLPWALASIDGLDPVEAPLVLEGGAVTVDGQGTLITTESVLLNPNRNPGITKSQAEAQLKTFLGAQRIIWLPDGLRGDETDGHVDNVAVFIAPGVVAALRCTDPDDENFACLQDNLAILSRQTDARGRRIEVVEIELPPPLRFAGRRLTASYVNFYFVNGGLIVPAFGEEHADAAACAALAGALPERSVVPVRADVLVRGGGGIHCLTQQIPFQARER